MHRRVSRAFLCLLLCLSVTGCNTILGDGPIQVVTAPAIVTPRVLVTDSYGQGDASRFDIEGTDAFYLLPGIENDPDRLQDFNCLDYTDKGYFVYYYCGPAYISASEVEAYKGKSGTAPQGKYLKNGVFKPAEEKSGEEDKAGDGTGEEAESPCDAMIVMAYNCATREYHVMDAQSYSKETANSQTGGQSDTGMDFYASQLGFYMLSHCYGCRIAGTHHYYIFDQNGNAVVWDDSFQEVSRTQAGPLILAKVQEVASSMSLSISESGSAAISGIKIDSSKYLPETSSDDSFLTDDSDEAKEGRKQAKEELARETGANYDDSEEAKKMLNCLVKTAVMDASDTLYFSLMLYQGDNPWISPILLDRVVQIYSFDFSEDLIHFYSYRKEDGSYTPFTSDRASFPAIIAGYGDLLANEGSGYLALCNAVGSDMEYAIPLAALYAEAAKNYCESYYPREPYTLERSLQKLEEKYDPVSFPNFYAACCGLASFIRGCGAGEEELLQWFQIIYKIGRYDDIDEYGLGVDVYSKSDEKDWHKKIITASYGHYGFPPIKPISDLKRMVIKFSEEGAVQRKIKPWKEATYRPEGWDDTILLVRKLWDDLSQSRKHTLSQLLLSYYYKVTAFMLDDGWRSDIIKEIQEGKYDTLTWDGFLGFLTEFELLPPPCVNKANKVDYLFPREEGSAREQQILLLLHGTNVDFSNLTSIPHCSAIELPNGKNAWIEPVETYVSTAGSFTTKWQLRFPAGTSVRFVDIDNASGSTTASVTTGALLFSDNAVQTDDGLSYTSRIRWQRENSDAAMSDAEVPGAAIDSGALEFGTGTGRKLMPVLITEKGVKFYCAYDQSGKAYSSPVYATNEELLSSTGFTPYTESAMQAAVSTRIDEADTGSTDTLKKSEQELSLSLNSSRVGTIQSASSFTVLSEQEVLISAYDTGLTLLRLNTGEGSGGGSKDGGVDRMQVQSGSYYQSFPSGSAGDYKIIGFNTEDYMYGSMDLARAKVYDFNIGSRKSEIHLAALKGHLDQLAVDYVRRLYRTRTEFTQDSEGAITGQKAVVVSFEDDYGEEAQAERALFTGAESGAIGALKEEEAAIGMEHQEAAVEHLRELRERIAEQQKALNEVLSLTGADKLGDAKKGEAYWVGVRERLQATTELGDLKDLLVEIALTDDVVGQLSDAEQKKAYQAFKKTLDYRAEDEAGNEVLADRNFTAAEFEEALSHAKTAEDFEGQYDGLSRGKAAEEDPLYDKLKLDNFTEQVESKGETDTRAGVRKLVLEDMENRYFDAHPLAAEKVFAPDGSFVETVTIEREDEAWDAYLEKLLARINPDNLAAARDEEVLAQAQERIAATGTTAARVYAQLVEFLCEGAGEVSKEKKIGMVADLLIGMGYVTGSQAAEEAVLIERMELDAYSSWKSAYDAFNAASYDDASDTTEGFVLSSGASIRQAKYYEQNFYKKLIVSMQESALVQAYLKETGQTWAQYMASLPMLAQEEMPADWDPEADARAVYETFVPYEIQ